MVIKETLMEAIMSKGPGNIQREIARILEADPDRAISVWELAMEIYGIADNEDVEKKHRVAVLRAIRTMKLPDGWRSERTWRLDVGVRGNPYHVLLANEYSVESQFEKVRFSEWGEIRPALAERIRRDVALNCRMRDVIANARLHDDSEEKLEALFAEQRANTADDEAEYESSRAKVARELLAGGLRA
jgi:hypothetical protein